jgi:hypothetical protein
MPDRVRAPLVSGEPFSPDGAKAPAHRSSKPGIIEIAFRKSWKAKAWLTYFFLVVFLVAFFFIALFSLGLDLELPGFFIAAIHIPPLGSLLPHEHQNRYFLRLDCCGL